MFMYLRPSTTKSRMIVQIKFEGIQDMRANDQAQPNKAAAPTRWARRRLAVAATRRRAEEVGQVMPGHGGHPPLRRGGGGGAAWPWWPPAVAPGSSAWCCRAVEATRRRAAEVGEVVPGRGGHPPSRREGGRGAPWPWQPPTVAPRSWGRRCLAVVAIRRRRRRNRAARGRPRQVDYILIERDAAASPMTHA
jgi:hypothetical protein